MKGMRFSLRLIVPQAEHPSVPDVIDVAGRITNAAVSDQRRIEDALYQIETLVNEHLPHVRLHMSLEER